MNLHTRRRPAQRDGLSDTVEKLRENLHQKMLSAVSHDLKTPLATIIGALEVYNRMNAKLTQEKRDILIHSALSEAYRLDSFINNILEMAKLENGMVNPHAELCNITHLIQDCVIRLGMKRSQCSISLNGDEHTLVVDPMLISRAINLILENAARHGGKNPVIDISYGRHDDESYVEVRDHGPGIPLGKEEAIFSKFTRYANSDQQNAGTGLGLAACRLLMRLMSGSVKVRNADGGGAAFTLQFPTRVYA